MRAMSLKCSDATASRSYRVTPDFSLPNTGTCMEVAGKGCKKTSGPTSYKAGDSSPSLWTVHEQHEYHTQANEYHNARKARTLARNKYEHGRSRHRWKQERRIPGFLNRLLDDSYIVPLMFVLGLHDDRCRCVVRSTCITKRRSRFYGLVANPSHTNTRTGLKGQMKAREKDTRLFK